MDLISQAEYARQRNRAKSLISRYVKQGRIKLKDGRVDPTQADEALGFTSGKIAHKKNGNGKPNLWDERARLVGFKADIAEMESKQLAGTLVTIDEVDTVFGRLVVAVRQRFLGLGNRVAPIGANKSAPELCEIIDEAVYGALNEFGKYNAESGKCEIPSKNKSIKRKTHKKIKRWKNNVTQKRR